VNHVGCWVNKMKCRPTCLCWTTIKIEDSLHARGVFDDVMTCFMTSIQWRNGSLLHSDESLNSKWCVWCDCVCFFRTTHLCVQYIACRTVRVEGVHCTECVVPPRLYGVMCTVYSVPPVRWTVYGKIEQELNERLNFYWNQRGANTESSQLVHISWLSMKLKYKVTCARLT